MALTYFEIDASEDKDVPFLNKHPKFEQLEDGEVYPIVQINETSSNGLLILTKEFKLFFDEGNKITCLLKEALNVYKTNKGEGYTLFAEIRKRTKQKAVVAADFDIPCTWMCTKGKYVATDDTESGLSSENTNPFLPRSAPHPTNTKGTRRQPKS